MASASRGPTSFACDGGVISGRRRVLRTSLPAPRAQIGESKGTFVGTNNGPRHRPSMSFCRGRTQIGLKTCPKEAQRGNAGPDGTSGSAGREGLFRGRRRALTLALFLQNPMDVGPPCANAVSEHAWLTPPSIMGGRKPAGYESQSEIAPETETRSEHPPGLPVTPHVHSGSRRHCPRG